MLNSISSKSSNVSTHDYSVDSCNLNSKNHRHRSSLKNITVQSLFVNRTNSQVSTLLNVSFPSVQSKVKKSYSSSVFQTLFFSPIEAFFGNFTVSIFSDVKIKESISFACFTIFLFAPETKIAWLYKGSLLGVYL